MRSFHGNEDEWRMLGAPSGPPGGADQPASPAVEKLLPPGLDLMHRDLNLATHRVDTLSSKQPQHNLGLGLRTPQLRHSSVSKQLKGSNMNTQSAVTISGKLSFLLVSIALSLLVFACGTGENFILLVDFDTDANEFVYVDDPFLNTNQEAYASGSYLPSGGFSGGALQVNLGGIDEAEIENMSGGWRRDFTVTEPGKLVLSFRYNLTQSEDYERNELSQVLVTVNGELFGQAPNNYVSQVSGNGVRGGLESTGWQLFHVGLGTLQAGNHSITIGGYNNGKNRPTESTNILIDEVRISGGNAAPVANAGYDQNVSDNDSDGFENVTFDGSKSTDLDGSIVKYEWSENGTSIAAGITATLNLGVGSHTIQLTVTDNQGKKASVETNINVNEITGALAVVNSLSFDRFKENLKTLSDFGDRSQVSGADTRSFDNAQNWVKEQLEAAGYEAWYHKFTYQGLPRTNLYVTKVGVSQPDKMYIISGHLDGRGGGSATNDDGSGSILTLEAALAFAHSNIETEQSVRFIFWANEESGATGAAAYVGDRAGFQGIEDPPGSGIYPEPKWLGIIQHDMIMFDHGVPAQPEQIPDADLDIEYQLLSTYNGQSEILANLLLKGNGAYSTDYPAEVGSNMSNTDSRAFKNRTASVSVRENMRLSEIGARSNPHHHRPTDVFSTYSDKDLRLGFNALQMTLGTVAELVGTKIK